MLQPDTLCADGEQVLALTSASATRRSCTTEVSTVMLLISAVPLLSSGGRWQQHAHALHHHHDIGTSMATWPSEPSSHCCYGTFRVAISLSVGA